MGNGNSSITLIVGLVAGALLQRGWYHLTDQCNPHKFNEEDAESLVYFYW